MYRKKQMLFGIVLVLLLCTGCVPKQASAKEWNLILVNYKYCIPEHYQVELTTLSNGKQVDSRIYPYLQEMFDAARADGLSPYVREGYRTHEEQQAMMDRYLDDYLAQGISKAEAKKAAEQYVAIPGTSEHELGISVDINSKDPDSADALYSWLNDHAFAYGFIKRYP